MAAPLSAEPAQLFIEDLKVELKGWLPADADVLGKALASDLQAVIALSADYLPMTFDNLRSQLRKEKRAQELSCSRDDQACMQKILENYGCDERLYGTVRQVGDRAQVSLTRYRSEQMLPGGASSGYTAAEPEAITAQAQRLAARLFNIPTKSPEPTAVVASAPATIAPPVGPAPARPVFDETPSSAPRGDPAPSVTDADVARFVDDWCRWQRDLDWSSYAASYDDAFAGVKRTRRGNETRYDRSAWLADRRKMFKPGLTVYAGNVAVTLQGDGQRATVRFRQYWKQGNYADQGIKQMTVRRSGPGWRVLSEELFQSEAWDGTPP